MSNPIVSEILGGTGPRVRSTDPETSSLAADASERSIRGGHKIVLTILRDSTVQGPHENIAVPLTEEQIVARSRDPRFQRISESRIRSSVSELAGRSKHYTKHADRPLIVEAGRGRTSADNPAIVWELSDAGLEAVTS